MSTTLRKEVLEEYKTDYFVEGGTYKGEGIEIALQCGFNNIFSIELHKELYQEALLKFTFFEEVKIFNGDTAKILGKILTSYVKSNATIFLDSHFSGDHTAKGEKISPLIEELEQIKGHYIKNHNILIDDIRYIHDGTYGIRMDELISKIKEINADYNISFADGYQSNDILIASIK